MTDEIGSIGYGTAFWNGREWEAAEGVDIQPDEVLAAVREALSGASITKEEFEDNFPLYLTEIRVVRKIEWEDVK